MKKNTEILTALIFILSCSFLYGQDSIPVVSKNRYIHYDIGIGYQKADLSSLNSSFKNLGYNSIDEDFAISSVSIGFSINRFLMQSKFAMMFPNYTNQPNNVTTRFGSYHFGFEFGYVIFQNSKFRVYPYFGLNSNIAKLRIEDNSRVENMATMINTPHYTATMYFHNPTLDVGFQFDKFIPIKNRKWDCPQNNRFMTLGLRIGYNIGLEQNKGAYNGNQEIINAPSFSPKGPYVKFIIGGGTKMRDLKWKR